MVKSRIFKSNCIHDGNLTMIVHAQEKAKIQKKPETSGLYLILVIGTGTV